MHWHDNGLQLARPAISHRTTRLILLFAVLPAVCGCAGHFEQWLHNGFKVGPDYLRPAAQVAPEYIDADDPQVVNGNADHSHWWTVFNDPVLDRLVQMSYQQNLPLRVAASRVLEARALLGIQRGNLFPQQQEVFAGAQHIQTSRQTFQQKGLDRFSTALAVPAAARSFDFNTLGVDAAWELDIWGRFRRSIEAANNNLEATVEDYDAVLVTLVADVAATYIEIRAIQQQLFFARKNVEVQQGSLRIAEARFRNGAVTDLDVQQAKSNLASTESFVPSLESSLRQAINRLCVLLGMPPQDIGYLLDDRSPTDDQSVIPVPPTEIAVGIPADLLRRRPDVRAAERRVAAQSALIGVAASDLFPAFTIFGSIQFEAENMSDLFGGKSVAGSIGLPGLPMPGIRWPILNYGRIRNNIDAQEARYQQFAFEYEQVVLRANQEVEDALVAFLKSQQQAKSLAESVAATQRSVELVMTQYRDGLTDFNRVFTLESLLADQQLQLAAVQGSVPVNLVRVYKALGGGWQIRLAPPAQIVAAESIQPPLPENALPNNDAAAPDAAPDANPNPAADAQPLPANPMAPPPVAPATPIPDPNAGAAADANTQPSSRRKNDVVRVGNWEVMFLPIRDSH